MKTRMERYYQTDVEEPTPKDNVSKRTTQNQDLYEEVVNIDPYNDNNEIDLTKLEEIIKEQEPPKPNYQELLNVNHRMHDDLDELERDLDKTFDINKIINKVKEETEGNTGEQKNIHNTQYDILSKIEIESEDEVDIDDDIDLKPEEKLQELFNTITTNSLLSKDVATSELALDVLSDLKPTDESQEIIEGVKERTLDTAPFSLSNAKSLSEIANAKEEKLSDTMGEQAKDFFTGNIAIKDDDFEDFSDLESATKSNSKLIWLLFVLLTLILIGAGFYIYTNLLKI